MNSSERPQAVIGILYCGDLGSALGTLLHQKAVRVVTTVEGRGTETARRAQASGVEVLPSLDAVVSVSDFVVSLVLPSAAEEVAAKYAARAALRPAGAAFVDANSIDAEVLTRIAKSLHRVGVSTIDGTIHGGAKRLADLGIFYLAGRDAANFSAIVKPAIRTAQLGPEIGSAKHMKTLIAGFSKSLNGLFLEIALIAQRAGMLDPFMNSFKHFYPGILGPIERMLPTYPSHAARRVGELESAMRLADAQGSPQAMISGAASLLRLAASIDWDRSRLSGGAQDIMEIVRQFSLHDSSTVT